MLQKNKTIIGWNEWVELSQIGLPLIKAKIDTGARTSALHAFSVEAFTKKNAPWVRFSIHPVKGNDTIIVTSEAPVVDRRLVTDSGGKGERRLVIETLATIDGVTRSIEVTLTNREKMAYRMLLGRQALSKFGFLVNTSQSSMLQKISTQKARILYKKMRAAKASLNPSGHS